MNAIVYCFLKSIFTSSDSFCLITLHMMRKRTHIIIMHSVNLKTKWYYFACNNWYKFAHLKLNLSIHFIFFHVSKSLFWCDNKTTKPVRVWNECNLFSAYRIWCMEKKWRMIPYYISVIETGGGGFRGSTMFQSGISWINNELPEQNKTNEYIVESFSTTTKQSDYILLIRQNEVWVITNNQRFAPIPKVSRSSWVIFNMLLTSYLYPIRVII